MPNETHVIDPTVIDPTAVVPTTPPSDPTKPPVVATKPIDFKSLDPEIQKYIDQERTKASRTAYEKAKDKLLTDPSFLSEIEKETLRKASLTPEEKLSEEQSLLKQTMENLRLQENQLKGVQLLMSKGMSYEQAQQAVKFVVTSDWETTQSRTNEFLTAFATSVDNAVSEKLRTKLGTTPTPSVNGSPVSSEETLKQQFAEASKRGDNLVMARITRQLNELKQ